MKPTSTILLAAVVGFIGGIALSALVGALGLLIFDQIIGIRGMPIYTALISAGIAILKLRQEGAI